MIKYIKIELCKGFKLKPFRICAFLTIIYSLFKLGYTMILSYINSNEVQRNIIINAYKNKGYSNLKIEQIIQSTINPSAISIITECCAGLLICGFFAGAFWTIDNKAGYYKQAIANGVKKEVIFGSKLIAGSILAMLFTIINLVIYFGGIAIVFHLGSFSGNIYIYLFEYAIGIILSSVLFVSFSQMIAILVRNTGITIASIALINVCGSVVVTSLDNIANLSFSLDTFWFISVPFYFLNFNNTSKENITYVITMLVYIVIFVMIGLTKFKRSDCE